MSKKLKLKIIDMLLFVLYIIGIIFIAYDNLFQDCTFDIFIYDISAFTIYVIFNKFIIKF